MSGQRSLLQDASAEDLQRLLDEDAALPEEKRRWPQDLSAILLLTEGVLKRSGVARGAEFKIAAKVAMEIASYGKGRLLYIPQGRRLEVALRDGEIWRQSEAGTDPVTLAERYQMAVPTIYEILREQKAIHVGKIQGKLDF